jgi:hypothetical protein
VGLVRQALAQGQGLRGGGAGLGPVAAVGLQQRDLVQVLRVFEALLAVQGANQIRGNGEVGFGVVGKTDGAVGPCDGVSHGQVDRGLIADILADAKGRLVEDLADGDFSPGADVRVGGGEHADEELDGACGLAGFDRGKRLALFGELAGGAGANQADGGADDADAEGEEEPRGGADEHTMSPGELADLVARAGASRDDRQVGEVPAQVGSELGSGLVSLGGLLGEGLENDGVEVAAEGAVARRGRRRIVARDQAGHLSDGLAGHWEGKPAGEHFVEDDSERIHVGAGVDGVGAALHLLGAHVGEGADDLASVGAQRRRRCAIGIGEAGDAEVEDLGLAADQRGGGCEAESRSSRGVGGGRCGDGGCGVVRLDEDVARLEVAVDDAFLVRVMDGVADAGDEGGAIRDGEVGSELEQRAAFDQLHREERSLDAVGPGRRAGLEDLGDAGVLESPEGIGLVAEAAKEFGGDDYRADHLQGDGAPRALLLGAEDGSHAADAEDSGDREVAEAKAEHGVAYGGGASDSLGGGAGDLGRHAAEELRRAAADGEERLDLAPDLGIERLLIEEHCPLRLREGHGCMEEVLDGLVVGGAHSRPWGRRVPRSSIQPASGHARQFPAATGQRGPRTAGDP